jgi:hypothetical protein
MKRIILALLLATVSTASYAATQFLSYEGNDAIQEGRGGSKRVVNGIEFWIEGQPPRKFQVLGTLLDERHETGLIGMARMSSLDSDIAKAAKQAGGDAVILADEGEKVTGVASSGTASATQYGNSATAFGFGHAREIKNHQARYVVVRYLPDAPPQPAPAQ